MANAEAAFTSLLKDRPAYLRIAYYLDRTRPQDAPLVVRDHTRPDGPVLPLLPPRSDMIELTERRDWDVSFSAVTVWESEDKKRRVAYLQACFPIKFITQQVNPGLVVITVDFEHWTRILTRSPRHLVFLAGTEKNLLMYPQAGRPAYHILKEDDPATEEQRAFTKDWLTKEDGLVEPSFAATVPVRYRYSPTEFGDDKWLAPPELRFLLLRYRLDKAISSNEVRRKELTETLTELGQRYRNLVLDTSVDPAHDEILVRGWKGDETALAGVRTALAAFAPDLVLLNAKPLTCTRFIRNLYKFSLAPPDDHSQRPGEKEARRPQCLYVAMASPIEVIDAKINDNIGDILGVFLACVLGAVALAVIGSHFLTRPLKAITAATQHLAAGGNAVRLPVEDTSEIGALARSFARMADQIQERQREIAERNDHLELRVRERTRELEAANVELAHARDKAENVAVAKDYFLATVSHELRTPLNHVIGFIQLLEMTALDEDQLRDVDKIHHAADNLLSLVSTCSTTRRSSRARFLWSRPPSTSRRGSRNWPTRCAPPSPPRGTSWPSNVRPRSARSTPTRSASGRR